jgi:hypothetical protein
MRKRSPPRVARPHIAVEQARKAVRADMQAGRPVSSPRVARALGVSRGTVDSAIAAERARAEALQERADLDASGLAAPAQAKLARAIAAHQRRLEGEFQARHEAAVCAALDERVLPALRRREAEARRIIDAPRFGIMSQALFKLVRNCLHPDSRVAVSFDKLNEAYLAFMEREYLLTRRETPVEAIPEVRLTAADLMARRDQVRAQRRRRGEVRPAAAR